MQTKYILSGLALLLCSACSPAFAPIATSTGTINLEEKSISETRSGVSFTVKLAELSVASHQMVNNITAFHVIVDNQTEEQVSFPPQATSATETM